MSGMDLAFARTMINKCWDDLLSSVGEMNDADVLSVVTAIRQEPPDNESADATMQAMIELAFLCGIKIARDEEHARLRLLDLVMSRSLGMSVGNLVLQKVLGDIAQSIEKIWRSR